MNRKDFLAKSFYPYDFVEAKTEKHKVIVAPGEIRDMSDDDFLTYQPESEGSKSSFTINWKRSSRVLAQKSSWPSGFRKDPLLQKMSRIYFQAFADDVVFVFFHHQTSMLQTRTESILTAVQDWGSLNKLNFAQHKTRSILLLRKLKYDPSIYHLSGKRVGFVNQIKLVG